MASPAEVRKEIANRKLPYKIAKAGGSWYVYDGGAELWVTSSLYTWTFDGMSAKEWVDIIEGMATAQV